jgi:phosphoribosyl 1,2-cyclic phosphodiesterase
LISFYSISSSSRGNAYILSAPGISPLLLEAGLPIKRLREELFARNLKLSDLAGACISHEHGDHAKAVRDMLKAGVDCYMSNGTATALGVYDHHRFVPVDYDTIRESLIGRWQVKSFCLQHDAADPRGFMITHGDDRLLFIPDTVGMNEQFRGVTTIAIECNHISDILDANVANGSVPAELGKRVIQTHMSLSATISMLKNSDLSKCRKIYLLHLSDTNSDEQRMRREIQESTGIPTEVC